MIGEAIALDADTGFPPRAALVRLIAPFQEMKQENGQAADQLPLFGLAHALDFLGDVFDVGLAEFARTQKLRLLAAEQGRDPIPTTLQIAPLEPDRLARFEAAGVTRVLRYVSSAAPDVVERELDEYAAAAVEYRTAGA